MRTILLMYYDDARQAVGDIASKSAALFADNNGYDFVLLRESVYEHPIAQKPKFIYRYLGECDRLIYADADVLLRPDALAHGVFVRDINVSTDFNGLCVGFMALNSTPEVMKVIRIWSDLGIMEGADRQDQTTFKMLVLNFKWIADLVYGIPWEIVSNPKGGRGLLAHHFWSQFSAEAAEQMASYRFGVEEPPATGRQPRPARSP